MFAFHFCVDGKHFGNGALWKWWHHNNHNSFDLHDQVFSIFVFDLSIVKENSCNVVWMQNISCTVSSQCESLVFKFLSCCEWTIQGAKMNYKS